MIAPIRKTVTVPLSADDAFSLFTDRIDTWWPKETHSLAAANDDGARTSVKVEPAEGGRILETLPDGSQAPWGTVTEWHPGHRFGATWHVGRPPEEATQIDVVFTQTEGGTRVDLTHSNWEALGKAAPEISAGYKTGWDHVLGHCFASACQTVTA